MILINYAFSKSELTVNYIHVRAEKRMTLFDSEKVDSQKKQQDYSYFGKTKKFPVMKYYPRMRLEIGKEWQSLPGRRKECRLLGRRKESRDAHP